MVTFEGSTAFAEFLASSKSECYRATVTSEVSTAFAEFLASSKFLLMRGGSCFAGMLRSLLKALSAFAEFFASSKFLLMQRGSCFAGIK